MRTERILARLGFPVSTGICSASEERRPKAPPAHDIPELALYARGDPFNEGPLGKKEHAQNRQHGHG